MDVTLDPACDLLLPIPRGHSAVAYLFDGKGRFGSQGNGSARVIEAVKMIIFEDGDHIRIQAAEDAIARFMVIAGAPFKEPIFPYGPFVMNTAEEIQQALSDLRNGTFVQN